MILIDIFNIWLNELKNARFLFLAIFTTAFSTFSLSLIAKFINAHESVKGAVIVDPILARYSAIDLTIPVFIVLYSCLLISFFYILRHPRLMQLTFLSVSIMMLFRTIMMYSLPLEAPLGIIPMKDPFVELFGSGQTLTKDLFFSGHTGTIFVVFLTTRNKYLKILFFIATIFVGGGVLLQKAHYFVDVISALFFAYGSFKLAKVFSKRITGYDYYD